MKIYNLYSLFLTVMINKDPETITFGWKHFMKKLILRYVLHLALAIPNNTNIMYILHLLDEFVPYGKITKLKNKIWTDFKKFHFSNTIHKI